MGNIVFVFPNSDQQSLLTNSSSSVLFQIPNPVHIQNTETHQTKNRTQPFQQHPSRAYSSQRHQYRTNPRRHSEPQRVQQRDRQRDQRSHRQRDQRRDRQRDQRRRRQHSTRSHAHTRQSTPYPP